MVVEAPHGDKGQHGRIHLETPTIGELNPRVETERNATPRFGFRNHRIAKWAAFPPGGVSELKDAKRVVALVEISVADVGADIASGPGDHRVPDIETAVEHPAVSLARQVLE